MSRPVSFRRSIASHLIMVNSCFLLNETGIPQSCQDPTLLSHPIDENILKKTSLEK